MRNENSKNEVVNEEMKVNSFINTIISIYNKNGDNEKVNKIARELLLTKNDCDVFFSKFLHRSFSLIDDLFDFKEYKLETKNKDK